MNNTIKRALKPFNPTEYSVNNMEFNKAFIYASQKIDNESKPSLLEEYRQKYLTYRKNWINQPNELATKTIDNKKLFEIGAIPLCLDLEVAAICDLACPFCYREYIATPDKVISDELAESLIKQASEIGIPSLKLNWRGEPLLYPRIHKIIDLAKKYGILETMINTNATNLSEKVSNNLIEAGLDVMIYSFDGGTKETYEKMRPGRFKKNSFDVVYNNIVKFAEIKEKQSAKFPRTKIQMILNNETFDEQESFFNLFKDYVDEISVKTYSERGGSVEDLSEQDRKRYDKACNEKGLPNDAPYMKDSLGNMWISDSRLPCEQVYQRLMVTFDGRVGMCCYDWGSQYPIGYVSSESHDNPNKVYEEVIEKAQKNHKGFELLNAIQLPGTYNNPQKKISTLKELWISDELNLVRDRHKKLEHDKVSICKNCTYKNTFSWAKI
jgi:MoaA/NifB/PqqE/SkfB family radical SAM enzyme